MGEPDDTSLAEEDGCIDYIEIPGSDEDEGELAEPAAAAEEGIQVPAAVEEDVHVPADSSHATPSASEKQHQQPGQQHESGPGSMQDPPGSIMDSVIHESVCTPANDRAAADQTELEGAPAGAGQHAGGQEGAACAPDSSTSTAAAALALAPPVVTSPPTGVTLVDDSHHVLRDMEIVRLLRQPRYFHEDFLEASQSIRCFNCGRAGHRAGQCTSAARQKPCYLCAQFGHDSRECPAQLCFRCGRPGHKSRECTFPDKSASWEAGTSRCLRCASTACACANKADYFRYEGGCSEAYPATDLARCKCYVCGQFGHLCCKLTPKRPARVTCYSCGSSVHVGEDCPRENRTHLAAERAGDMRRAQQEREAEIERMQDLTSRGRQGGFAGRAQHQPEQWWRDPNTYNTVPVVPQQPQYQQQQQQQQHVPFGAGSTRYDSEPDRGQYKRQRLYDSYQQPRMLPQAQAPMLIPQQPHMQAMPVQLRPSLGVFPTQPFVFGQQNPAYLPPPMILGQPPLAIGLGPPVHAMHMPIPQQFQMPHQQSMFAAPPVAQQGQSLFRFPYGHM